MQASSLSEVLDVDAPWRCSRPPSTCPATRRPGSCSSIPTRPTSRRRSGRSTAARTCDEAGRSLPPRPSGDARACQHAARRSACSAPTTSCRRRTGACSPAIGYMCDDPYTGTTRRRRRSARTSTRSPPCWPPATPRPASPSPSASWSRWSRAGTSSARCWSASSPGVDHTTRPVKISDSGRIRNELQTMFSQALEHDGDRIRVHFDRIDEKVMPTRQAGGHPRGARVVQGEPPGLVRSGWRSADRAGGGQTRQKTNAYALRGAPARSNAYARPELVANEFAVPGCFPIRWLLIQPTRGVARSGPPRGGGPAVPGLRARRVQALPAAPPKPGGGAGRDPGGIHEVGSKHGPARGTRRRASLDLPGHDQPLPERPPGRGAAGDGRVVSRPRGR